MSIGHECSTVTAAAISKKTDLSLSRSLYIYISVPGSSFFIYDQ